MNVQSEQTDDSPDEFEQERARWQGFQAKVGEINPYDNGKEIEGQLAELRTLAHDIETAAMARVVRWVRDTTLASARAAHPLNPVLDKLDADLVVLLKNLDR